ncbi:retrovirus-related pol polyprotein from transposon TNT 1-94 [Tanacetum coccineum]
MNQFCGMKGIKREFSVARTPQQNGVAKRKNRTLIEAARTMLADSLLPTTFWAEAVNTACYVQNRVLVTKPHNKTPYELLLGRPPSISFMRPFGCPVTILNTLDPLGKFDGKADEGFLVGYSINNKAFMVFNTRTRKVEENLHINFLENKLNVARDTQSTDDKDVDEVLDKGDDDENRLERGTIDKTLFIKKDKDNAQEIPDDFYGELTFFLGLQTASTPMEPNKALVKDEEADNEIHNRTLSISIEKGMISWRLIKKQTIVVPTPLLKQIVHKKELGLQNRGCDKEKIAATTASQATKQSNT